MSCKTCKYFEMSMGGEVGWCRRYPPILHNENYANTGEHLYYWQSPRVQANHWCGEYNETETEITSGSRTDETGN